MECQPSCSAGTKYEVVRGFQHTKGQYVLIEPSDLEAIGSPAKRTIHIMDFVSMDEVDPVYYEKPYYLQPTEGGERTYALLLKAMQESGKVGIGKVALREREHLTLIRPLEHALVMETIAFPDEVRTVEEAVPPVTASIDERELQMAHMLINSMSAPFTPSKYRDEYRESLTRMIEEKVEGGSVTAKAAPAPASAGVSDLMEMLRKSVQLMGSENGAEEAVAVNGGSAAPPADRSGDPFAEDAAPQSNGNGKKKKELVTA